MLHSLPARGLAALAAVATALPAIAQTQAPTAGETTDAPALPYRSAFENYQRFHDDRPVDWKAANDTVLQRGGWRAYAKEGSEATPAADPHAGHGTHGRPAAPPAATRERP